MMLLSLSAVGSWIVSLAQFDRSELRAMTDLGLVTLLPVTFFVALGLLAVSFTVFITRKEQTLAFALTHVGALIAFLHATPAILYGTPRYPFTYKHVGVAEYIQRHGSVDLGIDAYFNWPGFFAGSALLSDLAGLDSPLGLSTWGPVFMNVVIVIALAGLVHTISRDATIAWLAVWFFLLSNWVAQDYFAPQALGFALHLSLLAIFISFFGKRRWRFVPASGSTVASVDPDSQPGTWARELPPWLRVGGLCIILTTFAAIVAAHQLTPFITLASTLALILLRLGRARFLPVVMIVVLATWFTYMTEPYLSGHLAELLMHLGRLFDNINIASQVLTAPSNGELSSERALILGIRQWLTIFMAIIAILGGIRRVRRGYVDWVAIVLLLMPASMIALQPYGGEIIMRIYLFSLPMLAWFAAAAVFPNGAEQRSRATGPVVLVLSIIMMTGMVFAYYGNESMNYVTEEELRVLEHLHSIAPTGALVVTATHNAPVRAARYEELTYLPLSDFLPLQSGAPGAVDRVSALAVLLHEEARPAVYVLFSRSQAANARLFGLLSDIDIQTLELQMEESPRFGVLRRSGDASLFEFVRTTGAVR